MPSPTVALQRSRGSRQQRQRNVEATCGARDALRRPRMMDSHIFSPETCAAARLCGVGSVRSLSFVSCCRVESGRYRIAHANSEQGRAERAVRCRDSCVFFAESVERGGNNWKVHCDCPLPFQSQTARMGSGPGPRGGGVTGERCPPVRASRREPLSLYQLRLLIVTHTQYCQSQTHPNNCFTQAHFPYTLDRNDTACVRLHFCVRTHISSSFFARPPPAPRSSAPPSRAQPTRGTTRCVARRPVG